MIGVLLTIVFVIVLFGIRVSINEAREAAWQSRRRRRRIPKEWRDHF